MHQFQQFKKNLLTQLQLFSLQYGTYPENTVVVMIANFPLLVLLKKQSSSLDKILLPPLYWQNKEQTNTYASLGAIDTVTHIPTVARDAFYLGELAFHQQEEQGIDFPETLFIPPLMLLEALKDTTSTNLHCQLTFHFNGNNRLTKMINAEGRQPPQPSTPRYQQTFRRQDSPNQSQRARLIDVYTENQLTTQQLQTIKKKVKNAIIL